MKDIEKVLAVVIGLIIGLGLVHIINFGLVKGIQYLTYNVFSHSLSDKFWPVYVGLIVIGTIAKWLRK